MERNPGSRDDSVRRDGSVRSLRGLRDEEMPELYLYAIVALSALVALGFYLVLRDDKQTRVETAQRRPAATSPAVELPSAAPAAALPSKSNPAAFEQPTAEPAGASLGQAAPERRRPAAEADQAPMQALVTHLSREVEELRAERAALKEEVRQLRGALADAMMANREPTSAGSDAPAPAHANVYSLPTKRVS